MRVMPDSEAMLAFERIFQVLRCDTIVLPNGGVYRLTPGLREVTISGYPDHTELMFDNKGNPVTPVQTNGYWKMDEVGNTFSVNSDSLMLLVFHGTLLWKMFYRGEFNNFSEV